MAVGSSTQYQGDTYGRVVRLNACVATCDLDGLGTHVAFICFGDEVILNDWLGGIL